MKKLSIALSLLFYACIPPLCPDVRRESPSGASSGGRARTRPLADIPPYVAPTLNFDLTQCVYPSNLSNSRSGGTVYLQRDSHTTFVAPTAWLCENRDDGGGWATWIHDTFTNYITQPFDFSSLWTVANTGTVSTNIAVAPDGTSTADRVLDTDATNNYSIRQTGGVSSTVPNASSIWVQTSNTPPNISGAGFATNIGVSIATLDNNWLRIPIVYSKSASLPANLQIFLAGATSNGSGGLNFNGSATGGYNLWGAQAAIADADVPLIQGTTTASNVAVNGSLSSVVQSTADFHVQVRHLMDPQFISLTSGETLYPFSLTTPDGDSWVDIATNVVANAQINGGGAGTHSFVTFNYGAPLEMGYELFSVGSKNVSGMNLWIQGCRLGGPNSNRNTAITFQAPS
ncbi:MAG TPA: hypothetical protein VI259_12780 [Gemmatimonadaceae bacterium]